MTEQLGTSRDFTYQHDGLTLAYAVVGDGPQPILFVHGATATGEFEWAGLAAALGPGYRCILPDLRGHGRSEFRATATKGTAVRSDLRYLIEYLDLGRPHIVGFSYGAEIALTLELDNPGLAQSLILISPGTGRPSDYRAPRLDQPTRICPFYLSRQEYIRDLSQLDTSLNACPLSAFSNTPN